MDSHQNEQQKQAEQRTKRFVVISFALHIAFFLSFSIGSYFAPQSMVLAPSVQIDMVALPDTVKNQQQDDVDLTKPVKEDTPPAPPPEPEAKKPEPVAEPTPPAQPDPDEMALEKEKEKQKLLKDKKKLEADAKKRASDALKKMKEEAEKERLAEEKKRKEALEKRKKDLKDFEETYRRAQRGNQKNEGNSLTGEMVEARNAYQGHLLDKIRSKWTLPPYLQGKGYRAVMRMYLDGRGNVIKMEFKTVSGNNNFDDAVERTIRQSGPFFPPPAEMAPGLKNSGVEVQFPL